MQTITWMDMRGELADVYASASLPRNSRWRERTRKDKKRQPQADTIATLKNRVEVMTLRKFREELDK